MGNKMKITGLQMKHKGTSTKILNKLIKRDLNDGTGWMISLFFIHVCNASRLFVVTWPCTAQLDLYTNRPTMCRILLLKSSHYIFRTTP